jgi:uncharacterized repeat protein (TIGR03803 family)
MPPLGSNSSFAGSAVPSSSSYRTIYSFGELGRADDGIHSFSNLVVLDGELYGTTEYGGTTNANCYVGCGTVFRISTAGKESVIYRFKGGSDGAAPAAGLVVSGGSLYGTTSAGGGSTVCSGGCGTIFKLSPNGKSEAVLHSFRGGTDGAGPVAGLVKMGSALYGTTPFGGKVAALCETGCGTVFELSSSGTESVIYRFKGGSDGAGPLASLLVFGGKFYGTTQYGGTTTGFCETGCGTIFKMSASGGKTPLHAFKYARGVNDGAYPAAALIAVDGELYGTTFGGGSYGAGTAFAASASASSDKVLHDFQCCHAVKDGQYPYAPLTAVNGKFYGVTGKGGTSDAGTVFVVTGSGAESVLHDFESKPDGAAPHAGLTPDGGALYGTTTDGGSASEGTVFTLTP